MVPTGSLQCTMSSGVRDSDSMSTFASECTEAERAAKKQKVSWSNLAANLFHTYEPAALATGCDLSA